MTTLADIAKKLNIATSTVSRAISNPDKISAHTRKLVLETMKEMDYKVNYAARNLRSGKSSLVGVIISDLTDNIMAKAANSMQEYALSKGYQPIVVSSFDSPQKELELIEKFQEISIDGLIIVPTSQASIHLKCLDDKIPVVELDRSTYTFCHDEFRMDDRAAMSIGVNYLKNLGHSNITVISGDTSLVYSFKERVLALHSINNGVNFNLIELKAVNSHDLIGQSCSTLEKMIASNDCPNAIIACNSLIALGATRAIAKNHLKIGKDIDLFSIDNADWISTLPYPIASLAHSLPKAGLESMRRLIRRIENKHKGDPEVRTIVPKLLMPFEVEQN